jgi:hypothetical protein
MFLRLQPGWAAILSNRDHFRKFAFDCLRMASDMTEARSRAVFIEMATAWAKLAEQNDKNEMADAARPPLRVIP